MPTSSHIKRCIEREVNKLVGRYNVHCQGAADNRRRYRKRSGTVAGQPATRTPAQWDAHAHFNPFHVRSRLDCFAHAIARKVRGGDYCPNPSIAFELPKPGGGSRRISVFSIPDAAVSYWLGDRLITRNAHFFSSYSYAYRRDRNAHHAIQHLMGEIRGRARVFLLEYDFASYFDSIEHEYVLSVLRDQAFLVSKRELELVKRFLKNKRANSVSDYRAGKFEPVDKGIPQGATISLFLANVACYQLDRELERNGATFARYADDTVVLCDSYEKADRCAKALLQHGKRSGAEVNFVKSAGISILTPDPRPELRATRKLVFLGHSLSPEGVRIARRSLVRAKKKVARIIYNHLLLQPKRAQFNPKRIGPGYRDWDLVTCVNELRRYIYGRLTEAALNKALDGGPVNLTRCAMSFFPTVDWAATEQLRALDGWLLDTVHRAHQKRAKLLGEIGIVLTPVSKKELVSGDWYQFSDVKNDAKLPSFYKSWAYTRKCAKVFGLTRFPSPEYGYF